MVTALTSPNASFPTSASYFVRNGDSEGFVDVAACVTIDGHGYDSRNSQPCKCDDMLTQTLTTCIAGLLAVRH